TNTHTGRTFYIKGVKMTESRPGITAFRKCQYEDIGGRSNTDGITQFHHILVVDRGSYAFISTRRDHRGIGISSQPDDLGGIQIVKLLHAASSQQEPFKLGKPQFAVVRAHESEIGLGLQDQFSRYRSKPLAVKLPLVELGKPVSILYGQVGVTVVVIIE